jgi:hypothetical protein
MLITRPQNLSIEEIATANKVPRAQKQQVLEVHGMHAVCKPFY